MADANPTAGADLPFLSEAEIRAAQDLLFFAYRDFTNAADVILEELGLGRAHHRALHFIGRNPGIPVTDLLAILRITKQSLARVLGALVGAGYVAQTQGRADRRQRLLALTPAGQALERRLFERQRAHLAEAFQQAGAPSVEGFRRVMRGIMDEDARAYMERAGQGWAGQGWAGQERASRERTGQERTSREQAGAARPDRTGGDENAGRCDDPGGG